MKETKLLLTNDILFRNSNFFRKKFGLTRKSMALLMDMPPFYIRMIDENCWFDNSIEASRVMRMAEIFGVDMHLLLKVDYSTQQPANS